MAREVITMRLTDDAIEQLNALADAETNGNRSEMIRTLIREGLTRREILRELAVGRRQKIDARTS
jgi:metal-responsive CopG/Arc/MetJ family transcriptional regulator